MHNFLLVGYIQKTLATYCERNLFLLVKIDRLLLFFQPNSLILSRYHLILISPSHQVSFKYHMSIEEIVGYFSKMIKKSLALIFMIAIN